MKDSPVKRRGRILEPAVGAAVAEARPDWQLEPAGAFFCDTGERIAATPDFLIGGDPRGLGVLQAKTADPAVYARDWSSGAEVPFWITLQALTEAMLTNAAFAVVAVLSVDPYGLPCSIHEIERHPEAEAKILAAVMRFWGDVERGIEPEPDYGRDAALIKILAPREAAPQTTVDLRGNNELPDLLTERAMRKERQNADKKRCEEIETQIKFLMRDAAVASLDGWRITYKTGTVQGYSVPTREQRTLRITQDRKESRTNWHRRKSHPIITLQNQLSDRVPEFKSVLPAHISPERFMAVVKTAVIDNADLLAADRQSLFRACRRCAQDGLMPDGHEAALVLFKNRVQYIPMYQGLLKLFRNSGQFKHVNTGIVYEGEEFAHWLDETGEHYRHVPGDERNPKAVRRIYATATTKDGGFFMVDMSLEEVNKHRAVSRASREDAPWKIWKPPCSARPRCANWQSCCQNRAT